MLHSVVVPLMVHVGLFCPQKVTSVGSVDRPLVLNEGIFRPACFLNNNEFITECETCCYLRSLVLCMQQKHLYLLQDKCTHCVGDICR